MLEMPLVNMGRRKGACFDAKVKCHATRLRRLSHAMVSSSNYNSAFADTDRPCIPLDAQCTCFDLLFNGPVVLVLFVSVSTRHCPVLRVTIDRGAKQT